MLELIKERDNTLSKFVRAFKAIAFLPLEESDDAVKKLYAAKPYLSREITEEKATEFIDFLTTYSDHPDKYNVSDQYALRTNNHTEAQNKRFNKRLDNSNFWAFVKSVSDEFDIKKIELRQFLNGAPQRGQSLPQRRREERITQIKWRFENEHGYDAKHFIQEMSELL